MRHVLTSFLAFHWMAIFGLLAFAFGAGNSGSAGFALFGISAGIASGMPAIAPSILLSIGFSVVAMLFLWVFVSAISGRGAISIDTEEVARTAFGAAIGALTVLLLARATVPSGPQFTEVAALVATLLASYLAIFAERWSGIVSTLPDEGDIRAAARIMAAGAAHNSLMLARLSARPHMKSGPQLGEER